MPTLIFVHGIGVRRQAYDETFHLINSQVKHHLAEYSLQPCFWGESLGARLGQGGRSVPGYATSRGLGAPDLLDPEALEVLRWERLFYDPLCELRLLAPARASFLPPTMIPPGENLRHRIWVLAKDPVVLASARRSGLGTVWNEAVDAVGNSQTFTEMCSAIADEHATHRQITSVAVVATAQIKCATEGLPLPTGDLRDEVVRVASSALGSAERGIVLSAAAPFLSLANRLGTSAAERRKRALTEATYPLAGDVLVYQTRGQAIREFIRNKIAASDGPVVLIAHSLGGIACVDLLISGPMEKVAALLTVGSQSPFLYELDCLSSLRLGEELPAHFPRWINFYDTRDFLSFIGAGVFPGRVVDVELRSRQPFPASHSAYWSNPQLWEHAAEFLA